MLVGRCIHGCLVVGSCLPLMLLVHDASLTAIVCSVYYLRLAPLYV